ncbi:MULTISPECIES: LysR family transcriptional regulator [unclassified Moritella]|uniref:LysR family transcriptional regulator n=1 Tax=unclassified Moritella TaxID=2637987 RepID=UPI001BAD232B|nr:MULTISPECIES: LysR family transcriptional regulator [unclassified Moritella]QUM86078.1 LysR family transcriptional regulator [Moritella sp. 28]QUM90317.1 LysR family transcriptional regulator [Moritella sp. 36]
MRSTDDFLIFYHLIEQGSFSKAADIVGLTKSVVSKHITRLEKEMGVQLIFRTTRKLTLTEAGKVFFEHARTIYQSVQGAVDAMNGLGDSLSGSIRLTVPTVSGEIILAEAIADFSACYPDIHVHMDLDNSFVDLIDNNFDLAIRTGALQDSSYIARRLVQAQWVICASPAYLAKNGTPKRTQDLDKYNCLAYSHQESGANDWLFKGSEADYSVKISGNFSTNNSAALRKAALFNLGLIYVPKVLVADDLQVGTLVEVLPKQVAKSLGIYAIYPYTKLQPLKVKLFIEHIYQFYQRQADNFS